MKNLFLLLTFSIQSFTPIGAQLYSDIQSILPADTNSTCVAYYSTRDASGNVYVTGRFFGTINFSGSDITLTALGVNNYHSFIARLNDNGTWAWAQKISGVYNNANSIVFISGIAHDALGNIFLTGRFAGTAQFGSISITSTLFTQYADYYRAVDMFIAKLAPNGTFLWVQKEGTNKGPDISQDIIIDQAGNAVIAGSYTNKIAACNLCPGSYFNSDIFIAKYNASGTKLWSKRMGNNSGGSFYTNAGSTLNTDATGNIFVGGRFVGQVKFGNYTLKSNNSNIYDAFAMKLNSSGVIQWAKGAYSSGETSFQRSAIDASGNVIFGGKSGSNFVYNNISYPVTANSYLFKVNGNGNGLWRSIVDGEPGTGDGVYTPRSIISNPDGTLDVLQVHWGTNYLLNYSQEGIHQDTETLENISWNSGDICFNPEGVTVTMTFNRRVILQTETGLDTIAVVPSVWENEQGIFIATFVQSTPPAFSALPDTGITASEDNLIHSSFKKMATVDDFLFPNEIQVYPNPANEQLHIRLPESENVVTVFIQNQYGRTIWSTKFESHQQTATINLDGQNFQSGIYYLVFISNGEVQANKFVIDK